MCGQACVLFLKMKTIQLKREISLMQRRQETSGRMLLDRRGDPFYIWRGCPHRGAETIYSI